MGGPKKKEKKSSASSEDDACTNCSKLAELIETQSKTIESLTARIEALESLLKQQQNQPELTDQATKDRIRATEEMVEDLKYWSYFVKSGIYRSVITNEEKAKCFKALSIAR